MASKPFLAKHVVVYLLCDTLTIILTFKHSKMANERTFLSWIRTALVFLTFSIGFLQFYRLEIKANTNTLGDSNLLQIIQTLGKPLGAMGTILSGLTVTFGTIRYFQVQELLLDDYYPVTRFTIIILILINLSILVVSFILNIDISLFVML